MTQDHLVLDFPLNGPANARALADELPPLMPDLAKVQDDLDTVHFSRFVVEGDEKLLFFSDRTDTRLTGFVLSRTRPEDRGRY